jgi:hypothetical protein
MKIEIYYPETDATYATRYLWSADLRFVSVASRGQVVTIGEAETEDSFYALVMADSVKHFMGVDVPANQITVISEHKTALTQYEKYRNKSNGRIFYYLPIECRSYQRRPELLEGHNPNWAIFSRPVIKSQTASPSIVFDALALAYGREKIFLYDEKFEPTSYEEIEGHWTEVHRKLDFEYIGTAFAKPPSDNKQRVRV